jgi:hypothetical protein
LEAWINIAKCAREILATYYNGHFVLGFTLCGSNMRIWDPDRVEGISSEEFDISSKDGGLKFATAILGSICVDKEGLEFDSTVATSGREAARCTMRLNETVR